MDNSLNASRYHSSNKDPRYNAGGNPRSDNNDSMKQLRLKFNKDNQRHVDDDYQDDDEQEYERRREEELKRQIYSKEAEIQNLAKASDYLRNKLDQNVSLGG